MRSLGKTEILMKTEMTSVKKVLDENPRLSFLEKEMAELFVEIKNIRERNQTRGGWLTREYNLKLKSLKTKFQLYLRLLSLLVSLDFESFILDYE